MAKSLLFRCAKALDRLCRYLPRAGNFRPLRGGFSAFELLEKSALSGAVLQHAQTPGPCPGGSMTERCGMRQHDYQPWPIFWVTSDDARLVGKASDWRNEADFRCSEAVYHYQERRSLRQDRLFAQILVKKPVILPGAWTSLASTWADGRNYYHWLLDSLTRLMVRETLPEPTRILIPESTGSFVAETLEMLGLTHQVVRPAANCVQPERYYFCAPTAMTGACNPTGYGWLRKRFEPYSERKKTGPPVFLTRRGGARAPDNLAEIEETFSNEGFAIVDCGTISVKEQIRVTSMAPRIAGLHGAAMTNLLWARPGIPVLEIFQPGYLNACYEQIALHGCLSYRYEINDAAAGISAISRGWLDVYGNM